VGATVKRKKGCTKVLEENKKTERKGDWTNDVVVQASNVKLWPEKTNSEGSERPGGETRPD